METTKYFNKHVGIIALSGAFWGTSFPAVSYALRFISPSQLLFFRFLLSTIIAALLFPKSLIRALKTKELAFIGLLNGIAYAFQFYGQQWIPAGLASILVNSYIVLAPLFAFLILGEQITFRKITAAIIGLLGIVLITEPWGSQASSNFFEYMMGVIIVFGSGTIWGVYITFTKKVQVVLKKQVKDEKEIDYDVFVASMFYAMIVGLIVFIGARETEIHVFEFVPLFSIIYLVIFCSIIPFLIYLKSLDKVPVSVSTIVLLIEVVVAFYLSILYLGEVVTLTQAIGSLVVLIGIFLGVTVEHEN